MDRQRQKRISTAEMSCRLGKFLSHMIALPSTVLLLAPAGLAAHELNSLPQTANSDPITKRELLHAYNFQVHAITASIVSLANTMDKKKVQVIKVPSCNYADILKLLQVSKAKFLLPDERIPEDARIIFRLESEQSGLSQTVYFN